MTPYAVLLVKPSDSYDVIRKAYHDIAKKTHPDRDPTEGAAWETATAAYTAIKTQDARETWERMMSNLANPCDECACSGVKGTRMFKGKIRVCENCKGMGRLS